MLPLKCFKSLTSNYRLYHKDSAYFPVLEVTCDMGSTLQASTVIPVAMDLWIKGKCIYHTPPCWATRVSKKHAPSPNVVGKKAPSLLCAYS